MIGGINMAWDTQIINNFWGGWGWVCGTDTHLAHEMV